MNLYFVRHGQTDDNVRNIVQGRIDNPLNDTGRNQADEAGQKLRDSGINFDILCISPLKRALESAQIINSYLNIKIVKIEDDLIEREFGVLEGTNVYETRIKLRNPNFVAPGFETNKEICKRVYECVEKIREYGENILIVCHSHTIKAFLSEIDTKYNFESPLTNAQIIQVTYDGKYTVK